MAEVAELAPRRRGLTLTQLAWLVPVTAILVALRRPTQDNSYLWHIEAGIRQIMGGSVLTSDPFTFTAQGEPWRTQSWLVELVYGWFEPIKPLVSAPVVVGVAAVVLLAAVGLRAAPGRGIMGPLGAVWVMWLSLGYFTARPVFPSLALLAVVVLVADRRALRWTLPLLFWIWASVHGGFFIGLGYLVLQGLRHRDWRYLADVAFSVLAASLTAHGWGAWETLLGFAGSTSNLDIIAEWLSPDLFSLAHFPFLLAVAALVWLATVGRVEKETLWVLLPFLLFAFTANRAVPMAAIVLAPFIFVAGERSVGHSAFSVPLSAIVVVFVLALPTLLPIEQDLFESRFPVQAAQHLDGERSFHDDSAGGYLIYTGAPNVFIDDRAELFGDLYTEFADARAARPGWEKLFERFALKRALLRTADPIGSVLDTRGWVEVYSDENFRVLRDPD